MTGNEIDIKAVLGDPENASPQALWALVEAYPAFSLPAVLLLKYHDAALDDNQRSRLRLHAAITSADRKALYDLVAEESADFANIYPPAKVEEKITTENVIDTFFANYGMADRSESEMIERMIFNPVPDYAEQLAREEAPTDLPADDDSLESRIDAFIRDHRPAPDAEPVENPVVNIEKTVRPAAEVTVAPPATDDVLLSESLAKIFIKQGRYERAYEIISNLNLNYPKKSIYFADQLRFLQKLIKIKQAQQSKS